MRPLSRPHSPESTGRKSHRQKSPQTPVKGVPPPNFAIVGLPEPASLALSDASDVLASPQRVSAFVPADEVPTSSATPLSTTPLSPTSLLSCTAEEMAELAIYEPKKAKKATQGPDVHQFQSDELDEPATPPRKKPKGTMHENLPDESLFTKKRRRPRKEDMGGCFAPRCTSARSNPHP